jgi:hypothetical protein
MPGSKCDAPRLPEGRSRKHTRQKPKTQEEQHRGQRADDELHRWSLTTALAGRRSVRPGRQWQWRGPLRHSPRHSLGRRSRVWPVCLGATGESDTRCRHAGKGRVLAARRERRTSWCRLLVANRTSRSPCGGPRRRPRRRSANTRDPRRGGRADAGRDLGGFADCTRHHGLGVRERLSRAPGARGGRPDARPALLRPLLGLDGRICRRNLSYGLCRLLRDLHGRLGDRRVGLVQELLGAEGVRSARHARRAEHPAEDRSGQCTHARA